MTTLDTAALAQPRDTAAARASIDDIIDHRMVRSVFQPLVSLGSRELVAMEALSRGPQGWLNPAEMFEVAEQAGRLRELDRLCQSVALDTAIAGSWPSQASLFLNTEPSDWSSNPLDAIGRAAAHDIPLTVELTERNVARDVSRLLLAAEAIRAKGGRVAMDDVGAHPASLALLPLLRPDVVKLDISLLRDYGAGKVAETANAVRAYAEETGATVVSEGIETEPDVRTAEVLGATIGQGWLFGRPAPLEDEPHAAHPLPVPLVVHDTQRGSTPYDVVSAGREVQVSTKRLLLPVSHSLEQRARAMSLPPILLAGFQQGRFFTPHTALRYARMAERLPLVCAFGTGMPATPATGVRGGDLSPDDPLRDEWTVIVLGAHFSAALVSRDLGDAGADADRRFSYVVTHDRALVTAAARTLIDRVART